ncbi:response regulator transcription factor [Candidatus Gracilibacteria bacterium]|nr:response regulator transcription factor [Candidatus Gracilibacteria bacterium]
MIDDDMVIAAMESGAVGCVIKDSSTGELLAAIRAVAQGETVLHPRVAQRLLNRMGRSTRRNPFDNVTERERDVLRLVAHGMSNNAIAVALGISCAPSMFICAICSKSSIAITVCSSRFTPASTGIIRAQSTEHRTENREPRTKGCEHFGLRHAGVNRVSGPRPSRRITHHGSCITFVVSLGQTVRTVPPCHSERSAAQGGVCSVA